MIDASKVRQFDFLIRIILLIALAVFIGGVSVQAGVSDDVVEAFEKTYAEIMAQVNKGKLSPEVGAKANELRIGLKKYLIKSEAQLEILQLDVIDGPGEKRQAALNKMMAISAERERIKVGYLQRLQALKGGKEAKEGVIPLLPVEPEQSKARPEQVEGGAEKTAKKENEKGWSIKELKWEIEIAPEDISTGERE